MKHTPCEYIVWHGLPIIRKEIALTMIDTFGLKQKDAAEKLGLTPSAISQYLSGKRGNEEDFFNEEFDEEILNEIKKSAENIINKGEEETIVEICRLCKLLSSKKIFNFICESCNE